MKPPIRSLAPLVALLVSAAGPRLLAQGVSSAIRKIADIDTIQWYGFAEPASGRFLVYANGKGIHVINPQSGKETYTIDHAAAGVRQSYFGGSLSISASGRRLAFLATGDSKDSAHVWTVDLDTTTGKPVGAPHRVSIMPAEGLSITNDGRWIALVSSNPSIPNPQRVRRLMVIPSDGGPERLLDSAGRVQMPRWTPDGKTIYYIRGRGNGPALTRIAAAGGKPDSLASAAAVFGVSADGRFVAYEPPTVSYRAPLRVADLQGRDIASISLPVSDFFVTWSRHEPATMFGTRQLSPTTLKTVAIDNGKLSTSPIIDRYAFDPHYSPDGRRLALVSSVDDRLQIVVIEVASNQRRVIHTPTEPNAHSLRWSPDGSRLAFVALDSSMTQHSLQVVDLGTSRVTRLIDLGTARLSHSVLFRWRSDGQSIDVITGTEPHGGPAPSLERVTLNGGRSLIRTLPSVPQGNATDGGYRLLDDTLIAIARDYSPTDRDSSYLKIIDARTGATQTFLDRVAYWANGSNRNMLSPDGKWVAFGSVGPKDNKQHPEWAITSLDGKTVRLLGEPMLCDAWPHQWLPNSKALIAYGAASCDEWREELYVVPIDGGPARHIPLPNNHGVSLTPDGRSLLVAALEPRTMALVALDVRKAIGAQATQAGTPSRKSGKN